MTSETAEPFVSLVSRKTETADPAADTMAGTHVPTPAPTGDWQLATVTALRDAEDLLDRLEMQGCTERELVILGDSCFAVRWR